MNKYSKRLLHYLASVAIAFGIVGFYALLALNLSIFNPLVAVLKEYSMTDFYYQVVGTSAERDTSRIVTIVDMTELKDRRDIAYALSEVLEQHPKVVGIDILFDGLKPENPEGDSLIMALAANNQSLVFALQYFDDSFDGQQFNRVKQAFFADSIPNLKEGLVNMQVDKFNGMRKKISLAKTVKGKLRPSMIKQLSDEYADQEIMPLEDKEININWSPIDFRVVPYDSIAEYGEYLADRVVLFGAVHDENDTHYTPHGNIPGIKLLAYGVESVVKQTTIKKSPWWVDVILSLSIVLLTKYLFEVAEKYVRNHKNRFARIGLKATLAMGILRFICIAIVMYIGFIIFAKFNISINIALAIAAIAFIGSAEELYKVIHKSFSKK
ncbi:MAG: CHASE2 domain-containing protein [Prevotella sp.]|nr:CHASE2 domain-containing protein [Prevotella sp.]